MSKKLRITASLLSVFIFILVSVLAVFLMVKFITPPQTSEQTKQEEITENKKIEEDQGEKQVGTLNGNMFQTNKFGLQSTIASDDINIYRYSTSLKNALVKTDMKENKTSAVLSGYEVKHLTIVKNNLFFAMSQYDDEGSKYFSIAYLNTKDDSVNIIKSTASDDITSIVSDGKYIYFTRNDYQIYQTDTDENTVKLFKTSSSANYPVLIGINNGKLYYINGSTMCSLGIHSKQNQVISLQYCSEEQMPILTDDGIISFTTLAKNQIDKISFDGELIQTLITEEKLPSESLRIDSMNYYNGYVFLSIDNHVYYLDKNKDYMLIQIDGEITEANTIYTTDKYLIFDKEKDGNVVFMSYNQIFD